MSIDDGILPDDFATQCRSDTPSSGRNWYSRLGIVLTRFGTDLCHVKFRQRMGQKDSKAKDPLWSDLSYYFHIYFTIKLLAAFYCQCMFDYHRRRLTRFDRLAHHLNANNVSLLQTQAMATFRGQLVEDYEDARRAFKTIGAPYMQYSYISENVIIYLLILKNCVYLIPQMIDKFDLTTVYLFASPQGLQESIDALIGKVVNQFIISSRTYNQIAMEEIDSKQEACPGTDQPAVARRAALADRFARQAQKSRGLRSHKFLAEKAKAMAMTGKFQPFHRRQARLRQMVDMYSMLIFSLFSATLFIQVVFELVIPHSALFEYGIETDPMDILFQVEVFLYLTMASCVIGVYASGALMTCVDQVYLVSELCRLMDETIIENTHIVRDYLKEAYMVSSLDGTPVARSSHVGNYSSTTMSVGDIAIDPRLTADQMFSACKTLRGQVSYELVRRMVNVPLMQILIHYKIFIKQLRSLLKTIRLYITIIMFLVFVPPVITRLLIAYLDKQVKHLSIVACVLVLVGVDISLTMICWLHERCMGTYSRLHSLMAHTIAMDRLFETRLDREAYDRHLVQMLRRELSHPDRLTDQFSTRLLLGQSNMTYASLIRYHVWWGILTVSIMVLDPTVLTARDIFGGVWRYLGGADAYVDSFFSDITSR